LSQILSHIKSYFKRFRISPEIGKDFQYGALYYRSNVRVFVCWSNAKIESIFSGLKAVKMKLQTSTAAKRKQS